MDSAGMEPRIATIEFAASALSSTTNARRFPVGRCGQGSTSALGFSSDSSRGRRIANVALCPRPALLPSLCHPSFR
jgi:hypothetical protein